jgi:hypothetical protein
MLEDFTARLKNDPRFKNMSSASIYNLFIEMLTATMDMTNYYMERTSEEAFIDTAKLDSSVIKHGKNLGYNPIRNTPAEAEIAVVIRGPLPQALMATTMATIYFPQEDMELTYNGKKYILNTDYSYTLTRKDIEDGQSSTWTKTLYFSKPADSVNYVELSGEKLYNDASLVPIKVFQGEVKVDTIYGVSNTSKLGKSYQFYDIDNIKFSNWYGKRDPNGWYKDQFFKKNSWCKVGIGKNQEEAFTDENLYDIEDVSIYLNSELQKERTNNEYDLLNICSLTTNSDKTIRLRFGDGVNVSNGLNKEDQNIYIQYIECDGAYANKVGTTNSELKINNKIWATFAGSTPIDMSSNVKLIFNGDIANGVDFEDQQSIKNNAPLYFASNNKLVTKQDFISYFRGLSTPIRVKNAIAWGQDEIENGSNVTYKYIQNCICYCIAASLYNTKSTVYSPINVLTDNNTNQAGVFSVYGTANSYLAHLTDFIKYLNSYDSFHAIQYMNNPTEQWLKNIKTIRDNAIPRMIMNSKLYSFPPIVQYYDVVGSVSVNSLSKLQEYKREVENEIYKWLDNNCNFGTKIYKSDIVKFFNKRPETSYVDLDIRVSDIIKAQDVSFVYNVRSNELNSVFGYNLDDDYNSTGAGYYNKNENATEYNCVILPKLDNTGATLNIDNLKKKSVRIELKCKKDGKDFIYKAEFFTNDKVYETESAIYLTFTGKEAIEENITVDYNSKLTVIVAYDDDFYSTSNFSPSNSINYGLDNAKVTELQSFVSDWVKNATAVTNANRAIPLPYFVSAMGTNTREETIVRKGILQNAYETQLTEKAFWLYLIPTIIKEYYPDVDLADEDINGETWTQIDNLVRDLYTQFKATFCDSILDDNNNIVNFSMDNELPVVRLNIKYKYGV